MTWVLLGSSLALLAVVLLPRPLITLRYKTKIHTPTEAPQADIAIVFGAGLTHSGRATVVLADRVLTAVELYQTGKVSRILLSGWNSEEGYDEPAAMADLAIEMGVPSRDLILDGQGTRTFDSCVRAAHIHGVENALLVTQRYHLPRALVTCEALGIEAHGVLADRRSYRAESYWTVREYPATLVALWDAYLRPIPDFGDSLT